MFQETFHDLVVHMHVCTYLSKMFSKTKKILFLTLVVLIGIFIYLFIKNDLQTNNQQTELPLLELPVPDYVDTEAAINFNIQETGFNFPQKVKLLGNKLHSPLDESQIKEIAKNYSMGENYRTTKDVKRGTAYIWTDGGRSLTIFKETSVIEYSDDVDLKTIDKQLTNTDIIKFAKDFISKSTLITNSEIENAQINYMTSSNIQNVQIVEENNALFYQVNFSPKVSDFKLVTPNPNASPIFVWILKDGTVKKAYINPITTFETEYEVNLKTYKQLKDSIEDSEIVNIDDGNVDVRTVKEEDIKKLNINEIDLGYLTPDLKETHYLPVFILEGEILIENHAKPMNVTMYLKASI